MPNVNQTFAGSTLVVPSVAEHADVSNNLPVSTAVTNTVIFVAQSYGGVPKTAYTFSNPNDLKTFMRGSPSAGFVDWIANPGGDLNGATYITLISPSPNTAASGTIYNSNSDALLTMTAVNYGSPGNTIRWKMESGSTAGSKLTIFDPYANQEYIGDNITVPFQLTYTGSATGVTYSVTLSNSANAFSDAVTFNTSGGAAGENVSVDLTTSQYNTIGKLVEYLNGTGAFRASLLGPSSGNQPSANLVAVTNQALTANTAENVSAGAKSIVYWLNNSAANASVSGTLAANAPAAGTLDPATSSYANLTGGTNVNPSTQDYTDALAVALNEPGAVLFIDSSDASIQTLGADHVETASTSTYNAWRRYVTGTAIGDSTSTAEQNARALNTIHSTFCYPGIIDYDSNTGLKKTYSGLYVAAAVAGAMAGNAPALPLTNKALRGIGVETNLTIAQIDALQQAGVMCVYYPTLSRVPTIVSDLTTWQNDNNPENVFNQQVSCRDALSYLLAQGLQPYIGQVASTITLTKAKNKIKAILNNAIYNPASGNGILDSWDAKSLVLNYTGTNQTLVATMNVKLVGQYRFIEVSVVINPLNISA